MADPIPPTGSGILDDDLKRLLEFSEEPDLSKRLARAADPSLSVDDIVSIVPLSALRMAKGLFELNENEYRQMRDGVPTEAQPFLDRARQFAIDQLAPVVQHPSVQALGQQVAGELTNVQGPNSASTRFNVVAGVHHALFLIPHEGQLVPSIRLFLDAHNNKQLIDCTLELDNLAFLVSGLVQALKSGMAATKTIDGACRLTLSEAGNQRLRERLGELADGCHDIEQLAREPDTGLSEPNESAETGAQDDTA